MAEFDDVKAEALRIVRRVKLLRGAEEKPAPTLVDIRSIDPKSYLDHPLDTPAKAFEACARFWASRVAKVVTYDQWEEMVWYVSDNVSDFPGNVISFFEVMFDGKTLKDGCIIYH